MMIEKRSVFVLALCLLTSAWTAPLLHAQDTPPVTPTSLGFNLPTIGGQVNYALTASQTFTFGYNGNDGNVSSTNVSGNFAYLSRSEEHPFGLIYTGGYLGSESSQQPSSTFQSLSLSQVYRTRKDALVASDTVSYLPQSPVTGLSGIPGLGDLGQAPVPIGGYTGPGILTQYARRVSNNLSVSDTHTLTGSTSLQGTGYYQIERFIATDSLPYPTYDSNQVGAIVGLNHRLNARNSVNVNYSYTHFSFVGQQYTFDSNGVNLEYVHHFSPNLVFDGSVGPQWESSTSFTSTELNAAVTASLLYSTERSVYSLGYTRGTTTGFGVVQGALTDTVGLLGRHNFSRTFSGSASLSYSHAASLPTALYTPFTTNSEIAGVQATHSLGEAFSVFASYTLQNQSSQDFLANTIALNGLSQTVGFGITYSPRTRHFRQ